MKSLHVQPPVMYFKAGNGLIDWMKMKSKIDKREQANLIVCVAEAHDSQDSMKSDLKARVRRGYCGGGSTQHVCMLCLSNFS